MVFVVKVKQRLTASIREKRERKEEKETARMWKEHIETFSNPAMSPFQVTKILLICANDDHAYFVFPPCLFSVSSLHVTNNTFITIIHSSISRHPFGLPIRSMLGFYLRLYCETTCKRINYNHYSSSLLVLISSRSGFLFKKDRISDYLFYYIWTASPQAAQIAGSDTWCVFGVDPGMMRANCREWLSRSPQMWQTYTFFFITGCHSRVNPRSKRPCVQWGIHASTCHPILL